MARSEAASLHALRLWALSTGSPAVSPRLATMDALSEANGTFALTLLKKLGEDNSNNVFISPLSISSALAMVLVGTMDNTAAQMCQMLSLSKTSVGVEDVHQGFQNLL